MTDQIALFEHPSPTDTSRVVSWFSCGAASACATKLAIDRWGDRVVIAYTDPKGEHPDNARFLADCERWFGRAIIRLVNNRYRDPWDVMETERFIVGPTGAKCTGEMKKALRYRFQRPDDVQVFGYTAEERTRADRFRAENFEVHLETPLIDAGMTKDDCLRVVARAGIEIPVMYRLGFRNNNCLGCPKGGMGYWNMIRQHFPDQFNRMARLERSIGATCLRESQGPGQSKTPLYLDELAPDRGNILTERDFECSLLCHGTESEA